MKHKRLGFTVVELSIVIVVIAILATITIVSYNGVQRRAQIASVMDGLNKVERSFQLWALNENMRTWPLDPIAGGGVPLQDMIDTMTLKGYMTTPPKVTGVQTQDWFYDNEGDEKTTTCGQNYSGVNIVIRFVTDTTLIGEIDKQMDDGDLNCGRIRSQDQRIFLVLSRTQKVQFVK
jgi:prepilin-type N-terminal cleavage/methylation domain-containing protein